MNEDNNIELPKRIDEEPNLPENNENLQNENIASTNDAINENLENLNTGLPSEENINQNNVDNVATFPTAPDTNIFDENVENSAVNENLREETLFEPIKGLENIDLSNGIDKTDDLAISETPRTDNTAPNQNEEIKEQETENFKDDLNENLTTEPIENENQLDKKVVSVEPIKKEKSKGNPIIGFLALLLILAIILAAFYYFIKMEYIIIPDEIKDKIPFFSTTITTTTIVNENQNDNDDDELSLVNIIGEYTENSPLICPDVQAKIILNQDKTFSYNQLSFDEGNNNCEVLDITGNYLANNGILDLIPTDESIIVGAGSYQKTENKIEIKIVNEDKTIAFSKIN